MRITGRCVIALLPFMMAVAADPQPIVNGTEWTFDIAGTETYSSVLPSTVTKVIKTGEGQLTFTANSADFHGDVNINQGVVVATHFNALGRGTGTTGIVNMNTITVASGAQLRATFDADKSDGNTEGRGFRSYVVISGDGPDGTGAFFYDHAASDNIPRWLIYELRLAADASIGGGCNYLARTIDLNFNTLTIKTTEFTDFFYGFITNPGHITCENKVRVFGHTFNGGRTNLLELSATAALFRFTGANPINWSMLWSGTGKGTIECNDGGTDGTKNVIKGDVDVRGSQLSVWPNTNCGATFLGSLFADQGYFEKGNPGVFTLGGPTNRVTYFTVVGGTLNITNNLLTIASHLRQAGPATSTVRFENAGLVLMTNASCSVVSRYSQGHAPARLELAGNTDFRLTKDATCLDVGVRSLFGSTYDKAWGTVSIGAGASMSNNFAIGFNGRGAVYQKGGRVYWNVPVDRTGYIGYGEYAGYGYWGATNGTTTIPRLMLMAGGHADSTAFFVQRGGTTTFENEYFAVSCGGHGGVYLTGGANFTQTAGSTYMGYTSSAASGGDGTLTVDGAGTLFKAYWFVAMQNRTDFTTYINVNNGATFEANYIVNNFGASWTWPSDSKEYVSFDGGIWRTASSGGTLNAFHSNDRHEPDKFLCQKGGMTFDTRNATVNVNAPIEAPTGKTIKSITLPTDPTFTATTFIGPARIAITDTGSGVGATAFAPFNDDAKALRGDVIVTSRGTGYAAATTSVKVYSPDNDISWNCTFELEDAVSGGVMKYGAGRLAFKCANTYTGKTSVKEGWLDAGVAGSIQDGSSIEIAHGATLFISNALSVATIEGAGTLEGNNNQTVTVTDAIIINDADFNATNAFDIAANLVFGDDAKIRVSNIAALDETDARRVVVEAASITGTPALEGAESPWRLSFNSDRTQLFLGFHRGTLILLR